MVQATGRGRAGAGTAARSGALGVVVLATVAGCSLFGGDDGGTSVAVTDVAVGECYLAPGEVTAELTELDRVDCDDPHEQEAYANLAATPGGQEADTYPGEAALKEFADGSCAEAFAEYVGVDYRDSALFFTYLLPTARGWESGDHEVTCFITTTGEQLTRSVRGTAS